MSNAVFSLHFRNTSTLSVGFSRDGLWPQRKFRNAQDAFSKSRGAFRNSLESIYDSYEEPFLVSALQSVPAWNLLVAVRSAICGCDPESDFAEELWRLYRIMCFLTSDLLDNVLGQIVRGCALLAGYRPSATGTERSFYDRLRRMIGSSADQLATVRVRAGRARARCRSGFRSVSKI